MDSSKKTTIELSKKNRFQGGLHGRILMPDVNKKVTHT